MEEEEEEEEEEEGWLFGGVEVEVEVMAEGGEWGGGRRWWIGGW